MAVCFFIVLHAFGFRIFHIGCFLAITEVEIQIGKSDLAQVILCSDLQSLTLRHDVICEPYSSGNYQ